MAVVQDSLDQINRRLEELRVLFEDAQHKQHGAVTFSLSDCGRGCLGCPHPYWYRWVSRPSRKVLGERDFFAVKIQYPARVIAQSRAVKDHRAAVYMREIEHLVARRSRMAKNARQLLRDANKEV